MLAIGFRLTVTQILLMVRQRSLMGRSLLQSIVLAPLLALLLSRLFAMPPPLAAGLLLVAASPGAPAGPKFVEMARANLAYAIGLMFVLDVLAVLTTPTTASLLLPAGTSGNFSVTIAITSLLLFQFLPLLVGLVVYHWRPTWARRLTRPMTIISNLAFVVVVILVLVTSISSIATMGLNSLAAIFIFAIGVLIVGWLLGGPETSTRQVLSLSGLGRNVGLALLIASGTAAGSGAELSIIAYGFIAILVATGVSLYWGRQAEEPGWRTGETS